MIWKLISIFTVRVSASAFPPLHPVFMLEGNFVRGHEMSIGCFFIDVDEFKYPLPIFDSKNVEFIFHAVNLFWISFNIPVSKKNTNLIENISLNIDIWIKMSFSSTKNPQTS